MSIAQRRRPWISPEEYLEGEEDSPVRHEYIDGEVFAMAGGSTPHGIIAGNLFVLIHGRLRRTGCVPFMSDMKVRVDPAGPYYYPDIVVACDDRDVQNNHFKAFPRLIVEIASPKTAGFDRGKKFDDYTAAESLQEYVLIRQDHIQVECFRRGQDLGWLSAVYSAGDKVHLESIDLTFPIEEIYERVEL